MFYSSIGLAAMFVVLLLQVIARYVFRYGFIWTDEFSRFVMISISMLGAAVLEVRDNHTRVTMLEENVSPTIQKGLKVFRYLIAMLFSVGVIYLSKGALQVASLSVSPNMRISMVIPYLCIPIMGVLMLLGTIYKTISLFTGDAPVFEKGGAGK